MSLATVTALPGNETTASDELEDLVSLDAQGRDVMHAVRRLACPMLRSEPDELAGAWLEFCEAARIRDGLAHGSEWWGTCFAAEDLAGYGSAQEAAIDLMAQRADEAMRYLRTGERS